MNSPFEGLEVETQLRASARACAFDLDLALSSIVALEAKIPGDAFTAPGLGTERLGNGVVIGTTGLVLTIGYLIMEAEEVILTSNDGRRVAAHVLGSDPRTGFGLVQPLEPLNLPPLPLGDSRDLSVGSSVVLAGAGGRNHAAAGRVLARQPFAGYWEYLLDDAIFAGPAHPHWSGAALIGTNGKIVGVGSLHMLQQAPGEQPVAVNMFVPTELLPPILDDIARGKPAFPPRPWLGVLAVEQSDHVVVAAVSPASPAARAELRPGDVILTVRGQSVSSLAEFYTKFWALGPPGVDVPLLIQREKDVFSIKIRSADREAMLKKPRYH